MCTGNDCTPRHVTKARKGGKSPEKDCLPRTNNQSRGGLKIFILVASEVARGIYVVFTGST